MSVVKNIGCFSLKPVQSLYRIKHRADRFKLTPDVFISLKLCVSVRAQSQREKKEPQLSY